MGQKTCHSVSLCAHTKLCGIYSLSTVSTVGKGIMVALKRPSATCCAVANMQEYTVGFGNGIMAKLKHKCAADSVIGHLQLPPDFPYFVHLVLFGAVCSSDLHYSSWLPSFDLSTKMSTALRNLNSPRGLVLVAVSVFVLGLFFFYHPSLDSTPTALPIEHHPDTGPIVHVDAFDVVTDLVQYFEDYPFTPPYKNHFGQLGRRARILRDWLILAEKTDDISQKDAYLDAVDRTAVSLFPYLEKSSSKRPLSDLRSSFKPSTTGLVIPAGDGNVRFAAHLISSLYNVLESKLPIQIAYAGDKDLSPGHRAYLADLVKSSSGPPLRFLDILTVFEDHLLKLNEGGWAIKAFAILGSDFERVILLDADAVFLQKPEALFEHPAFLRSGALLFRDRLLWQHAFRDRHDWWESQIKRPSAMLNTSLVFTKDYAEEGDSGVVVVDKSRADVFVGLLHICWQNTYAVREEVTYKITYGDKESWWLGFELAGSNYEMEKHYGASKFIPALFSFPKADTDWPAKNTVIGWEETKHGQVAKVCSFVIAHVDEQERLIWYNGSLLKNKGVKSMAHEYAVPEKWMVDAEWQKGASKADMSCMVGGEMHSLSAEEIKILADSITEAKRIDEELRIP